MATPAPLVFGEQCDRLVERIRSARSLLHTVTNPHERQDILTELAAATQELSALVLGTAAPACNTNPCR